MTGTPWHETTWQTYWNGAEWQCIRVSPIVRPVTFILKDMARRADVRWCRMGDGVIDTVGPEVGTWDRWLVIGMDKDAFLVQYEGPLP